MTATRARPARPVWRLPVVAAVLAVFVGAGIADHHVTVSAVPGVPPPAVALAAPPSAQATTWYCVGGTSQTGGSPATLYLVNAGHRPVAGTITVESDNGATGSAALEVPADGQQVVVPGTVVRSGAWLASRLAFDGGGVAVTESVAGSGGWSVANCASTASSAWYFASGSTAGSDAQFLSLFNPTGTPAVVDMTFVTPQGQNQPAPFQGVVLQPGQLVVNDVTTYVQNDATVATSVVARSGQVVAAQLQLVPGAPSGLSLLTGSIGPRSAWAFSRSADVAGGQTVFDVFNPATSAQRVSVAVRLDSGPVSPIVETVGPHSTWAWSATATPRVPAGVDYAVQITSRDGPGVVVSRVATGPAHSTAPQQGAVSGAVTADDAAQTARRWLLADVTSPSAPATTGAQTLSLDLYNPDPNVVVAVRVLTLTGGAEVPLASGHALALGPGQFTVLGSSVLAGAASKPLVIAATGPVVAMEDLVPAGMAGVVSQRALPLAPG